MRTTHAPRASAPGQALPAHGKHRLAIVRHVRGRRSAHAALALLAVALAVAAAVGIRDKTVPAAPRPCATATVTRAPISGTLAAAGRLTARRTLRVGSELPGRVVAVNAAPGDAVKRGQVLARLEDADQRAAVAGAYAQVMSAGVLRLRAERQMIELVDSLRAQGLLPPALDPDELADGALGDVQLDMAAATAHSAKQEAGLALARAQLARRLIRAPEDGVVLSRSVQAGELVAAGPSAAPLFVISADVTSLRVEVEIDERHVGGVRPGPATFTTPAYGGYRFAAVVRQVALADGGAAHDRRAYVAILDAANADAALRPGMSADVALPIEGAAPTLQVPAAAMRDGRLWLPDANGRPTPAPIEVGVANDAMVEVSGPGVVAGGVVVSDETPATCVVGAR
jgi:HlyD family secretion protein